MNIINRVINNIKPLIRGMKGQGLVEYELVIALISIAAITVMSPLGAKIYAMFETVVNEFLKL